MDKERIDRHAAATKLFWVDLEMTGLDPLGDRIIEVAAKVTDLDFKVLATYESLVYQDPALMRERMSKTYLWQTHPDTRDELIKRASVGKPESIVESELAALVHSQFGNEPAVLAGNSIYNDRRFIRQWWPKVEDLLHYRMLDTTAWKIVMQGKYKVTFDKKEGHRALDDIDESIAELQYYLDWFKSHQQN